MDDNENYQQRNNRSVDRLKEQTFMKNSSGTPNRQHQDIPRLDFKLRQSHSQGGERNFNPKNSGIYISQNPITHSNKDSQNKKSPNLWYHQQEQKDLERRRQQIFIAGLNEQLKSEKQRRKIDEKYEEMSNVKMQMDQERQIEKEDKDKEEHRLRFEQASRKNDSRINHYLNNYYMSPKEKELRSESTSEHVGSNLNSKRKFKVLKKRKVNHQNDSGVGRAKVQPPHNQDNSYEGDQQHYYHKNDYYPKRSVLSKENQGHSGMYQYEGN